MKRGFIQNLSTNVIQLVLNQLLGLGIFYVLSTGLDKNSFGQINLALAVLLAAFNILSSGIDQLTIKKIASGIDPSAILSLYICHVLITGCLFYGFLLAGWYLFPNTNTLYVLLLLIGIGKLMLFFASPFKQAANGMEKFKLLAYMSIISNLVRCSGLMFLALFHFSSLHNIIITFISGDFLELLLCVLLFKHATKITLAVKWNKADYKKLLFEAIPQNVVVLITSALARFDWIFIGFIVSAVKLAEYSFAYKIFEVSTLPLLGLAPLLIPRFTKIFQQANVKVEGLKLFIRAEMIIAALTALLLNICWIPLIDGVTAGKYGVINVKTIFILSLCLPFLYLNNFLWTIYFAQGKLKMILASFIITFLVNVVGDILLIPFFKNEGAAFAFLLACIVQTIYYLNKNTIHDLKTAWQPLALCILSAFLSGILSKMFSSHLGVMLTVAVVIFVFLLFITRQVKLSDGKALKQLFKS